MFDKIWKEQIVQPTSKVGIFKPKQGFELEEDEEKDCCQEVKDFLKQMVKQAEELGFIFGRWKEYWAHYHKLRALGKGDEMSLDEPYVDGNVNNFRLMGFDVWQGHVDYLHWATKDEYNCEYLKGVLKGREKVSGYPFGRLATYLLSEWEECENV